MKKWEVTEGSMRADLGVCRGPRSNLRCSTGVVDGKRVRRCDDPPLALAVHSLSLFGSPTPPVHTQWKPKLRPVPPPRPHSPPTTSLPHHFYHPPASPHPSKHLQTTFQRHSNTSPSSTVLLHHPRPRKQARLAVRVAKGAPSYEPGSPARMAAMLD